MNISINLSGPEFAETVANRLDIEALADSVSEGELASFTSSSYEFSEGADCPTYIVPSLMSK
jgi:hypothetical protein